MQYLKYTYVDAVTKKSVYDAPAANGSVFPDILNLQLGFALESEYPTIRPTFYGTASTQADLTTPGILTTVSESEYNTAQVNELSAKAGIAKAMLLNRVASTRYMHEVSGTTYEGINLETTRESRALLTPVAFAAYIAPASSAQYKAADGYIQLSSAQIVAIASTIQAYVQACFDREAVLLTAITDGTFTIDDLQVGWPA